MPTIVAETEKKLLFCMIYMIRKNNMNRSLSLLIFLIITALAGKAQFTINQMPVFHDTITGNYLCTIPLEYFGNDLGADIEFLASVDSADVSLPQVENPIFFYTFRDVEGGKVYDLPFIQNNDTTYYRVTFTYLPIVVLKGQFGYDYEPAEVNVLMPGDTEVTPLAAKVKWRGASTNEARNNKRNYHIKFVDEKGEKKDRRFFGFRKDNSWLLDAGQIDLARIRNHVGMWVWGSFATQPFYSDVEPDARNYVRSELVEVMLNDEWRGVFSMGEAMDRKQLKLKKYDEQTKDINGLLWKTYDWHAMVWMQAVYPKYINNNASKWIGYEVKYPDLDEVSPTDYYPLCNSITVVADDTPEQFKAEVGDYFDLPVIRDYYILFQVLLAFDNDGKNLYWALYDKHENNRLTLAAWDLDATVGQFWNNEADDGLIAPELNPEYPLRIRHRLFRRLLDENPDNFVDDLHRRYSELRHGVLSEENLVQKYVGSIDSLITSGAAWREEMRWSRDSDLYGVPLDFRFQREYITQWIHKRLAFLDKGEFNLPSVTGDVNNDRLCDVSDVNEIIDMVLGKKEYSWRGDLDCNGSIDVSDLNKVIDMILGLNGPKDPEEPEDPDNPDNPNNPDNPDDP